MKSQVFITTHDHEADAAHLNAQGLHITIETDPDGTPFLVLTVPNGVKRYLNPGDALVWNPRCLPISAAVVPESLVTALTKHISSLISAAAKKRCR